MITGRKLPDSINLKTYSERKRREKINIRKLKTKSRIFSLRHIRQGTEASKSVWAQTPRSVRNLKLGLGANDNGLLW